MLLKSKNYAKVIYEELKYNVKLPKSHINNSFEKEEKLKNIILDDDHVLLSLDVIIVLYLQIFLVSFGQFR